jgi:hypothetical protein
MSIIRTKKDSGYFVAANAPFNNKTLSWEARGVLAYLLSKPDGWSIRNKDLYAQGPAGVKKMDRILAELTEARHLVRERFKKPDGKFEWSAIVYETIPPKRGDGNTGKTIPPKRGDIVNTDSVNTKVKGGAAKRPPLKTEPKKKKERDPLIDHPAVVIFKEKVKRNVPAIWRERVVLTVGDRVKEWGDLVDEWIGLGWNPTNVVGMLDAFRGGGIGQGKPRRDGKGSNIHRPQKAKPGRTKEEIQKARK